MGPGWTRPLYRQCTAAAAGFAAAAAVARQGPGGAPDVWGCLLLLFPGLQLMMQSCTSYMRGVRQAGVQASQCQSRGEKAKQHQVGRSNA